MTRARGGRAGRAGNLEGERLNVYRGTPLVQASATGNASGLGDIAVRAKYGLFTSRTTSLAAAGELRLPPATKRTFWALGQSPGG